MAAEKSPEAPPPLPQHNSGSPESVLSLSLSSALQGHKGPSRLRSSLARDKKCPPGNGGPCDKKCGD